MKGGEGGRAPKGGAGGRGINGVERRWAPKQQDTVLASMEIHSPVHSRIRAFPASRLRVNVDTEQNRKVDEQRRPDESTAVTPPKGLRMPARLRLSVRRRSRDTSTLPDYEADTQMADQDRILREEFPLTDRKRALFEPLGPALRGPRDLDDENMLPPPDFESASYPRGWVVGKKRKLVNVDVVESMRRIAVHEMNRKDREINGLNEQLEEDSRTMEHLQIQLQQERTKRLRLERENNMLQGQVNMLMTMLDEGTEEGEDYQMP